MPKKVPEYLIYFLEDCLEGNTRFTYKNMFGGYAIYKDGNIFSLYLKESLFFKVGVNNIEDYKKYNSAPFSYSKKSGEVAVMSYWELPEEILENKEELNIWIENSLDVKNKVTNNKKSKKDLELDNKILSKLLEIPKGKVTTYKILADMFGVHPRRIASVMKTNKFPDIYPCYKVVSHSKKISGYSGPEGVTSKIELLKQDGVAINNGFVLLESIYNF